MISDTLWIILFVITLLSFIFSLFRTYYNWRTLKESRQYWSSWKKRQADIARKVIQGMSDSDIIELIKKIEKVKKES